MGAKAHPLQGGAVLAGGGMHGHGESGMLLVCVHPPAPSVRGFNSSWGGCLKAKIEPVDMGYTRQDQRALGKCNLLASASESLLYPNLYHAKWMLFFFLCPTEIPGCPGMVES